MHHVVKTAIEKKHRFKDWFYAAFCIDRKSESTISKYTMQKLWHCWLENWKSLDKTTMTFCSDEDTSCRNGSSTDKWLYCRKLLMSHNYNNYSKPSSLLYCAIVFQFSPTEGSKKVFPWVFCRFLENSSEFKHNVFHIHPTHFWESQKELSGLLFCCTLYI